MCTCHPQVIHKKASDMQGARGVFITIGANCGMA